MCPASNHSKCQQLLAFLMIISRINTTVDGLRATKIISCQQVSFYKWLKFHTQLSMKKDLWPQGNNSLATDM